MNTTTEFKTFKTAKAGKSNLINTWQANQIGEIRIVLWNGTIKIPKQSLSGGWPERRYLCLSNNDYKYVHRIIAELFVPNPNNFNTVDHISGNKMDNRAVNLQWMTNKENKIKG